MGPASFPKFELNLKPWLWVFKDRFETFLLTTQSLLTVSPHPDSTVSVLERPCFIIILWLLL